MKPSLFALAVSLVVSQVAWAAEVYLRVEGMKTDACAQNVDAILRSAKGVTATEINREEGLVWVQYSDKKLNDKVLADRLSSGDGKHPAHPAEAITPRAAQAIVAKARAKEKVTTAAAPLPQSNPVPNPWDPIDETFRGCEGACGTRGEDRSAAVQPGARIGQRAYCPVSGVVFAVTASSPKAEIEGMPIYFCCEGCARHFAVARDEVLKQRRIAGMKK